MSATSYCNFYIFLALIFSSLLSISMIPGGESATEVADAKTSGWVIMDQHADSSVAKMHGGEFNFREAERASPGQMHECVFYIVGKGQEELESFLKASSDPRSPQYGQRMTKQQIDSLTKDEEGHRLIVEHLQSFGATVKRQTSSSVAAEAPVSVWEALLQTEFYLVHTAQSQKQLVRTPQYSLPARVAAHVRFVSNTTQMPPILTRGPVVDRSRDRSNRNN